MLEELLVKFDLTREQLNKKGRVAKEIVEKRSALVTHLHEEGLTWKEMSEITGLSNGSIQRLTKAKGCDAVRDRRKELGTRISKYWEGKSRHEQLKRQWAKGDYDFHRGRTRPQHERDKLKEGWNNPESKAKASAHSLREVWGNSEVKQKLMDFHQDTEERARRSNAQAIRMKENPTPYLRGKTSIEATPKGNKDEVRVRSSYEAKTISILESDPNVKSYTYEPIYKVAGRTILPDFVVHYQDGSTTLVEVKPQWALNREDVIARLALSQKVANDNGWAYQTWTEKELGYDISRTSTED